MSPPLVAAVGRVTVSFVGAVPRLSDRDEPMDLSEIAVQVGGGAAVALGTAATLGCRARLAGRLAADPLAAFICQALEGADIDVSTLVHGEGPLSPVSFAAVPAERGPRVAFRTDGAAGELAAREVDPDHLLAGAAALLLDGAHPAAAAAVAEAARERGIPVIFDGSALHEGVGELVALADVLICSERLASELAPRGELQDSLVELQHLGPRAVVITLGEAGSIGLHGDELVEQPAFPVAVVDSADAGDVFHGAFATALVNQLPFARCIEFASAAAALSCRALGAWAGIPARDEVVAFVREHRARPSAHP